MNWMTTIDPAEHEYHSPVALEIHTWYKITSV